MKLPSRGRGTRRTTQDKTRLPPDRSHKYAKGGGATNSGFAIDVNGDEDYMLKRGKAP